MKQTIRLILDRARPASLNMAIDEVLMESQKDASCLPVLRIYFWEKAAYSLGYFQNVDVVVNRFRCAENDTDVVRRITGGGLVLHHEDLTFSLSLKNPNPFVPSETKASYLKINEALMAGLRKTYPGVDFADCKTVPSGRAGQERICFNAPSCYDLLLDGRKVVGASQRRRQGVLLHQSTVFIKEDRRVLTGLILEGFQKKWGVELIEAALTGEEIALAKKLEDERYSSREWGFTSQKDLAPCLSS